MLNFYHQDSDICERKARRAETSIEAHESIKHSKQNMRERILTWAVGFGPFTLKDVCDRFGMERNQVSGRLSELKLCGELVATGERRDKCAVLDIARKEAQLRLF